MRQTAILGGGCFWCLEAVYLDVKGVLAVESGYCGGHVQAPSYEQVCAGASGHAEVVRLEFDPEVIAFDDLLRIFFAIHDPTTRDRQGSDVGPQYRSAIFYADEAQREVAQRVIDELEGERVFGAPIVTELAPVNNNYFAAEPYHQRYFERNPQQGYCMWVVAPKVSKFRRQFASRLR